MHNNILLTALGIFIVGVIILVSALLYRISETQKALPIFIEDQPIKILNRVEGINGPALYIDERIRTSLYNCNKTKEDLTVLSNGVFRKQDENIVIVIDPASLIRHPGCETTIRMSPGNAADRGLTPGTWTIEGTRSAKKNIDTLQTITFTSESFKVVQR